MGVGGRNSIRNPQVSPGAVAAIRYAFEQALVGHEGWEYRTEEGRLDSRNVWRHTANGAFDIFKTQTFPSPASLNVHILVDASGSMGAYGHGKQRWKEAQDFAGTLVETFRRSPTVRLNVWQFDTPGYTTRLYHVYGGPKGDRLASMGQNGGSGNADAFALRAIGNKAVAESRADERPVIIVISDGAPTDTGQGSIHTGHNALVAHSKQVAEDLRRDGAIVMAVSITGDDSLSESMYGTEGTVKLYGGDYTRLGQDFARIFGQALQS